MADKQLSEPLLGGQGVELQGMRTSTSLEFFSTQADFSQVGAMKEELTHASSYLKELAPVMIDTPFQGSALAMTKDEHHYVFGSREGRLGIVDRNTKQVTLDIDLKQGSIWTMTLIENDKYVLSAGASGTIKKLLFSDLSLVDEFTGHTDEINFINISSDESKMFTCSDDRTVRQWDLKAPESSERSEVLYYHNGIVYSCDLSLDEKYIASSSADRTVKVYSLNEKRELATMTEPSSLVWCVKIAGNNRFVTAGDQEGIVWIWEFGTWNLTKKLLGHQDRVRYMSLSLDSSFLVTAGLDHVIKVWDLKLGRKEITLIGHTNWVKFALISKDQKTVFSCADDRKVASWKIPQFSEQITHEHESEIFETVDASHSLIYARTSEGIISYNLNKERQQVLPMESWEVVNYEFTADGAYIYTFVSSSEGFRLFGWSLETNSRTVDIEIKQENLYSGIVFPNRLFFATGEYVRVNAWNIENMEKPVHTFRSHKGQVTKLAVSSNGKRMFSSDPSGVIKIYNTENWQEIHTLTENSSPSLIQTSRDNEYLFIATSDNELKIYSLETMNLAKTILNFNCSKVYFTIDNDYFVHNQGENLWIRDMDNFELITSLNTHKQLKDFTLTPDESMIIATSGTSTTMTSNPLKSQSLNIFGDTECLYDFIQYCYKIMTSQVEHNKEFDTWIIEPFHINALHLYASFNQAGLLAEAVKNHSPFFPSRSGHTPLGITIEKKFQDCIDSICTGLLERQKQGDVWALYHLGESIKGLATLNYGGLHDIFNHSLFRSEDLALPKFCLESAKLPQVLVNHHPIITQHDFPDQNVFTEEGKAVAFGQSCYRLPLTPGSESSIDFLQSILDCQNEQIYYSKIVSVILNMKWENVRWFIGVQSVVYIVYLVLLATYSIYYYEDAWFMIFPFIVSTVLFLYEGMQLYNSGMEYFDDLWNYVDIFRGLLFNLYCILVWFGIGGKVEVNQIIDGVSQTFTTSDYQSPIFTLAVLFSWLRGITYFKLFQRTRYLIKLIMEASVDIVSFFILLFYTTMAFAFIMQAADNIGKFSQCSEQDKALSCYISTAYKQNLGELSGDPADIAASILFIIICIVNPVIMLNLLISIMGDTYGRVKAGKVIADARELAGMIIEVETLMNWNRDDNKMSFIKILCEESFLNFEEEGVDVRIKALDELIGKLKDKLSENKTEVLNTISQSRNSIVNAIREKYVARD
ncbi:hypothetical protein SteCoe_7199 [Stentor coeruleus]|uniref:Ion transport domain-containing protein n=1 Tax=Stentor coeruleus TaxID=5963 RepID=A0A1R2CN00_9CILI|nr:hypothetical protein SteCoe_7199 [Stentor coeruleus]